MSYETQLVHHYNEVHTRLIGKPPKNSPKPKTAHHLTDLSTISTTILSPACPQITPAPLRPNLMSLLKWIGENEDLTVTELRSDQRIWAIGWPRFIFYHLAHRLGRYSCSQIARFIHRDHSTVIHGIGRLKQLRAVEPDLEARLCQYEALLEKADRLAVYEGLKTCATCPYRSF